MNWYAWPEPLKNRHLSALEEIYQSKKDFVRSGYNFSLSHATPCSLTIAIPVSLKLPTCAAQIDIFIAQQFLFQRQWQKVRNYAQEKGISIMGDMPIYVGYHSADVWANKKYFLLVRDSFADFVNCCSCYMCLLFYSFSLIMHEMQ